MKIQVGDTAAYSKTIVDADVKTFANLTGDYNPVHLDEEDVALNKAALSVPPAVAGGSEEPDQVRDQM